MNFSKYLILLMELKTKVTIAKEVKMLANINAALNVAYIVILLMCVLFHAFLPRRNFFVKKKTSK